MIRVVEAGVFLVIAGGLHLAALGLGGLPGGGADGAGGSDSITLLAVPQELTHLAERWERRPEVAPAPRQAALPKTDRPPIRPADTDAPARPAPSAAPRAPARMTVPSIDSPVPVPADVTAIAPEIPDGQNNAKVQSPPKGAFSDRSPRRNAPAALSATASAEPDATGVARQSASARLAPAVSLRPKDRPAVTRARAFAPPAPAAAQPRAAQRAKGTDAGGTNAARAGSQSRAETLGPDQTHRAMSQWGGAIRQSIARAQRYPRGTNARGIVTLRLSVNPAGRLTGVSVTGSSGIALLDRAALEAARAARLPRAPRGLTAASYSFNLPLQFARR